MMRCRQGLHAFLRRYYHYKSADSPGNQPVRLDGWTASELAWMPTYYIMDLDQTWRTPSRGGDAVGGRYRPVQMVTGR